jgi:NAD(P)-dependent dehydrogenase (short-subunit alcohol dehydrogenase family)
MSQLLSGKTAVITGGNSGIGLATAQRFVDEGAKVFVTGRRKAELDAAVKQLGDAARGVQGDVSNLADLDRLYAAVAAEGSGIDILFANAATVEAAPLGHITEDSVDRQLDVHFKGVLFTVQKALPLLNDGASIVLNASIVASRGPAGLTIYSAIKAAIRSFARTWAGELRGRKIRVNAVSPGYTATPGLQGLASQLDGSVSWDEYNSALGGQIPLGRLGTVEDVADAVLFLASGRSTYVTGAELLVDGGFNSV